MWGLIISGPILLIAITLGLVALTGHWQFLATLAPNLALLIGLNAQTFWNVSSATITVSDAELTLHRGRRLIWRAEWTSIADAFVRRGGLTTCSRELVLRTRFGGEYTAPLAYRNGSEISGRDELQQILVNRRFDVDIRPDFKPEDVLAGWAT